MQANGGYVADEVPYMMQVGNIPAIFAKIRSAGTPPKFTHDFLSSALGFKGSGDRGVIKLLRSMGFLTSDGTPTSRYNDYRSSLEGGRAIADGLREAYPGVFLADTGAHERSTTELTEIFKRVSGKGEASALKMASTFKAVAALGDWTARETQPVASGATPSAGEAEPERPARPAAKSTLSLHHDVHIHLPTTSDVSVYTAIFRALKDELLD